MQTFINSFQVIENQHRNFKIFGYTTKGMPGLEVVGFGKYGRLLKEKVIYFTKSCGIKVSNRRYVICLEDEESRSLQNDQLAWFEIPTLILFWTLADVIPLKGINDCFASGKIKANGSFVHHTLPREGQNHIYISDDFVGNLKIISFKEIIKEASEGKKLRQVI